MLFFDILIWMAVAKMAVVLLEDSAYAVRGKQSPRQRERAQHRAAEAAGQPTAKPSGGWGRTKAAVGGYLAGVVEDATAGARARKRRAQARRRGAQAVDGVFVDLNPDEDAFYGDCDLCGWSSRPFRIEANALAAGRDHTRTEHPEAFHPDPVDEPEQDGGSAQPSTDAGTPDQGQQQPQGEQGEQAPEAGGRPQLRVIPGGRQDDEQPGAQPSQAQPAPQQPAAQQPAPQQPAPQQPAPQQPAPQQPAAAPQRPRDEDTGPKTPEDWEREREAIRQSAIALLQAQGRCIQPDPNSNRFCGQPVDDDVEGALRCRYHEMQHLMQELAEGAWCFQPGPGPGGLCGQPADRRGGSCPEHQNQVNHLPATHGWECPNCGTRRSGFVDEQDARTDAATHSCPAADNTQTGAGNPAGARSMKEITVNLDATGPEEIRAAFTGAAEETGTKGEEITGLAGVLVEAADRFEQLQMAGSTVDLMREAAESLKAASGSLQEANEHLEAALADFNSKDGHVADTAADVGNLADKDVLVGS
jgi:hypothetical protein